MKPSSTIINTARGAVIDEAALVAALEAGAIASVGLDVYEDEPKIHRGLVANPRVMLLPHMGTWSVEVGSPSFGGGGKKGCKTRKDTADGSAVLQTQTAMEVFNVANIRSMLETGKLKSRVPEQKDMPYGSETHRRVKH